MDNSRVIKIFEDRQQKVYLSEEEKKDILSMKSIIGGNNLILQADGRLLIKHYVGFIQINKTRLLIYPKIANRLNDEEEYEKAFKILIKLLSYSGFQSVKKTPSIQMMGKYNGDLLELFIGLFVDELLFQFRRDVNRGYNSHLENQAFIKGKVDFSTTIKKNSFRRHLHCVRYDQFNENILLNQIFKSIIKRLIIRTQTRANKIKLKQALLWLEDVETIQLNSETWNGVRFTRHNFKYEPLFNLARLFYHNSSPNLNRGDENTFSFLVPVNRLFEKYLYEVLKRSLSEKFEVRHEKPIDHLAKMNDKKFLQLKPDITLSQNEKIQYIIDAKYKEITNSNEKLQVDESDIYQMLAYSVRYKCDNILLVYPKFLIDKQNNCLVAELVIENYDHDVIVKIMKIDLELDVEELSRVIEEMLLPN